jgi:hypothetical protein
MNAASFWKLYNLLKVMYLWQHFLKQFLFWMPVDFMVAFRVIFNLEIGKIMFSRRRDLFQSSFHINIY